MRKLSVIVYRLLMLAIVFVFLFLTFGFFSLDERISPWASSNGAAIIITIVTGLLTLQLLFFPLKKFDTILRLLLFTAQLLSCRYFSISQIG